MRKCSSSAVIRATSPYSDLQYRVAVALTMLAATYFGTLFWHFTAEAIGDGFVAAILVAIAGLMVVVPVAKLFRR